MRTKPRDRRLYWRGGKLWARVPGLHGRIERKSTHCTDEAAASAKADEFERRYADPTHAAAAETSLESAVRAYFTDLARRKRSAATRAIAEQKMGHFVRLWGAKMALAQITAALVLDYVDKRQREGVVDFTIKKELGHLGQTLRIARHLGTFHVDLERVMPPFFAGGHKPRQRKPTPDEVLAVLGELEPRRAAHLAYIAATGARLSESFRARRSDADWERRVVHIHGTKTHAADDDVPITRLSERLLSWSLANAPGKDRLFHPWGKLHRDLSAACVRAGIENITPNDLRRAFGSWHRAAGVPIDIIARLLRHTTDKLAQTTYANVTGADVSKLVGEQLAGVPILYAATAETSANADQLHDETAGKAAPPGRIGLPTNGLGSLSVIPVGSARSRGNSAAWSRRRALPMSSTVPKLYAVGAREMPQETPDPDSGVCLYPATALPALRRRIFGAAS